MTVPATLTWSVEKGYALQKDTRPSEDVLQKDTRPSVEKLVDLRMQSVEPKWLEV